MNLKECREAYYRASGKASEIVRQLGLAGIAVIWVFKNERAGSQSLAPTLLNAGILIVTALGFDLLHYASATLMWGAYARKKELEGTPPETPFMVPRWMNWPALCFFWLKLLALVCAYGLLLRFLAYRFMSVS
jgi:hypothetical protein